MMKKQHLLFTVLFLLLCLLPMAAMAILGPSQPGSNEVLANVPALVEKSGKVNWDYLSDWSAYVRDRFGFRQELITANAKVTAAVFGESATDKVILGRDGWLFYADTLADHERTAPMTQRQLWSAARTLALMKEYAAACGADFLFTVAPNKNSLYPEPMPFEKGDGFSNYQRLCACLSGESVAFCDLFAPLSAASAPVYYKTDSHWDGFGSALAHDAILQALGRESRLAAEPFVTAPHRGDLAEMLYPAANIPDSGLKLGRERTFSYVGTVRGPDDMVIRTTAETGTGSLLMFRDSFGNTLHQDLAESFAAATFSRAMPYDLSLLEKEGADTLLIEIVERNLVDLAEKAPVMEAPKREISVPEISGSDGFSVKKEPSKVKNCVKYSGSVTKLDENSPIFALLNGVVYEATPAGPGENSFTLHAPEAEEVTLLVFQNGQLVRLTR